MTKGETILFKILGSSRVFNQDEVKNILRKDPDALFLLYSVTEDPRYRILGSNELYTLGEIWGVIHRDPLILLKVYQSNRGSPCRENSDSAPMCRMGNMNGETALRKFG